MIELGKDNKCSGCTACVHLCPKSAISLCAKEDGFLYPVIDNFKCIECHLCERCCPWISRTNDTLPSNCFVSAKRNNLRKRMQSQSGGAFAVFAESVLKDGGIVYGVEYSNGKARYTRISFLSRLYKLKGSKYVQAEVGGVFPQVANDLANNKAVLFSGTACHVDGLLHYLLQKRIDTSKLITIDLICHGVVSPMVFENYKQYIEKYHKGKLKWFNFRDKSFGWHGHFVTYKIGRSVYKSKDYVKIFYSSYALRKTCYECQYSNLNRISDITIGDSWGIGDHYPEFDDNKGCSLIIINTKKGKMLFEDNKSSFDMIELDKSFSLQPNLEHPTVKPEDYSRFWDDYYKFGFEYVIYRYCGFNPSSEVMILKKHQVFRRLMRKINKFFGV